MAQTSTNEENNPNDRDRPGSSSRSKHSREVSRVTFSDIETVKTIEKRRLSKAFLPSCSLIGKYLKGTCWNIMPFFFWIQLYVWKTDLWHDIVAGMTVAVMHLPHGLAYAPLAHVPPVHGIYMGFFPCLVYVLFATSRHVSVGSFAVVCLMTGEVVMDTTSIGNATNTATKYTPIQVATAVTFTVGLIHTLMFFLRLGIITMVLSGTLITSFTCGASIHVFSSQVKELLGIKVNPHYGLFALYYQYKEVILNIGKINLYTLGMSVSTLTVLFVSKFLIVPLLQKKIKFRIPFELIIILLADGLSMGLHLEHYGIGTISSIPSGFPNVQSPPFSLILTVLVDSFFITIVSYSVAMSVATMFANSENYELDANQELLAHGLANIFGSFFQCIPASSSLSRSVIQHGTGGRSQIAGIVSSLILLIVLLWIGPFFEPVPKCVLSAVVVTTLSKMFLQIKYVPRIWKLSKLEAAVWIITFLSVIILDVKFGLLIGVILTLTHVFIRGTKPNVKLLGLVVIPEDPMLGTHEETILVECEEDLAEEKLGTKIIKISQDLTFVTINHIKKEIYRLSEVDPQEILKMRQRMKRKFVDPKEIEDMEAKKLQVGFKVQDQLVRDSPGRRVKKEKLTSIIVDMKSIRNIDSSGIDTIQTMVQFYKKVNVNMLVISRNKNLSAISDIKQALNEIPVETSTT